MQLMPETASVMQVRDIDDPHDNIFGGVRLLRVLANEFNGDLELTIAAYNAGDGAVIRFGGIPPFQQTRDYVVNVTKLVPIGKVSTVCQEARSVDRWTWRVAAT